MSESTQKLSVLEKIGYSGGDAAANFVFMTMVLFQTNFYTDVFGLSSSAAAAILLWPRLWDAFFDPIMGVLADRTNTRWGKFRPWVLWTSVPWVIVMILAYTTPKGLSMGMMIAYAGITNTILMTLYSMNNMPYSALSAVMTSDLNERNKLNSYRFVAVNIAQFIVGGCTLPLVAKFAHGHDRQFGWQMTMTLWAACCFVLFMVTFFTTKERIKPVNETKSTPKQDFLNLIKNGPWYALVGYTVFNFAMLTYRGGAHFAFYQHYADKPAMFDFLTKLGLTTPDLATPAGPLAAALDWIGYIAHGTRDILPTNVADVFNSIINMLGTATTIVFIILSASFARRFGKKTVILCGFFLAALNAFAYYWVSPTNTTAMALLAVFGSIAYAPTISVAWSMYADAADYSEWQTGHRFTGMVFATIGFALKSGLALGSAVYLWAMTGFWGYDTTAPKTANAIVGYHMSSSVGVGLLFLGGAIAISLCKLNKKLTLQVSAELNERRQKATAAA
ncbi:MAG: MFS transporter [Verrucomicrobia bacterium]|nr:MFS transporter [Verrucomicrobiota bacterium]